MKFDFENRHNKIALNAFIVICCSIIFYFTLSKFGIIMEKINGFVLGIQPIFIGIALAYLLNFVLNIYEDKISSLSAMKKVSHKSIRGISILLTYITAAIVLYLFMYFVLPQLIQSITGLANNIPNYVNNIGRTVTDLIESTNLDPEYMAVINEQLNNIGNYLIQFATELIPVIGGLLLAITSSIWNIFIGVIVSIYLLIDKEMFYALGKKMTYGILSKSKAKRVLELTHRSNDIFGKFLSGKILDSIIIGVLTFVTLTVFKMPYTLLVSVIIGITNIIPFFGPFIGAVPSVIIICFISPVKALWFILIIFVIQQIDGNIIGPKILGDSIGLSAFWILFSILIAGKLLGFIGMVIGVPLFAVLYSIAKEIIESKLKNKGLPTDTGNYL